MRLVFIEPLQCTDCLTRQFADILLFNAYKQPRVRFYHPQFTDKKNEPQRVRSTCVRSHSWWDQTPRQSDFQALQEMAGAKGEAGMGRRVSVSGKS